MSAGVTSFTAAGTTSGNSPLSPKKTTVFVSIGATASMPPVTGLLTMPG